MDLGGAQDLVILMALTGDQHQIAGDGLGDGRGNGSGPVDLNGQGGTGGDADTPGRYLSSKAESWTEFLKRW